MFGFLRRTWPSTVTNQFLLGVAGTLHACPVDGPRQKLKRNIVTSHERHDFSNHRQLDCLFKNKTSKLPITVPCSHRGQGPIGTTNQCETVLHYNDAIMSVSNHWRLDCLLNCLFSRKSKKTSKLLATDLCEWNSLMTGEFPTQRASNAENVSIWWRHHDLMRGYQTHSPGNGHKTTCPS